MEQSDVAQSAGVSVDTVKRLESIVGPVSANISTIESIQRVLEAAGVEFTNGASLG
jgi:predicted transcriptional regulator